jgi:hypothetical protein
MPDFLPNPVVTRFSARWAACCRWIIALAGVVAAGVAAGFLWRHAVPVAWVLCEHPGAAVLGTSMACGFVIGRGCLLSRAARLAGVSITSSEGCRLFCEGVAVELVAWPGKAWADLYRAASLPSCTRWQRGKTLVVFRAGTLAGSLVMIVVTLGFWAPERRWPQILAVLAAAALGGWVLRRRLQRHQLSGPVLGLLGPGVLAAGCDLAGISLTAWMLAGVNPLHFAGWFVLAGALAALSNLPLGLGVLDLGCWHVLTHQFGVEASTAAGIIALYRLTGPIPTLLLGALGLLARATPWRQIVHAADPAALRSPVDSRLSPRGSELAVPLPSRSSLASSSTPS